jgi:hypothetical protein
VTQEFYCGECKGYFLVTLNMALNFEVEIICPNCGHEHRRCINNGQIFEDGRYGSGVKEKIRPTKASYAKEPLTTKMREAHEKSAWHDRRDGQVVSEPLFERWLEIAAREKGQL